VVDTGLQNGQILKVAAEQRKLIDGFVGESPAQHIVGRIHDGRFFGDGHGFIDRTRIQLKVHADIFRHFELQAGALRALETGSFRRHCVRAGLEIRRVVVSRRGRGQGP
jgi:hypothetical protein